MTTEGNNERSMRPPRIFPPVYLLAAIISMVALHKLLPGAALIASPWRWLGLLPFVAAVALATAAVRLFRKHGTTIKPGETSSYLLAEGPYRYTRNPIYLGMVLLLTGVALMLGSLTPWLMVPVFAWLINRNVIPVEEEMMATAFGADYEQYRARVRRWL
ncbi:MAG TPA: isoprenylcysteine carboxylmethyltransferase family protein [Lacipirellulaceae bacterium]|jgi:protein-S-isoprenylcysteine O-methyltransferase Ste14